MKKSPEQMKPDALEEDLTLPQDDRWLRRKDESSKRMMPHSQMRSSSHPHLHST